MLFNYTLMFGIGLYAFIMIYAAFKAWEIKHQLFGIILFFCGLISLSLIPNVLYDNQANCYNIIENENNTIENLTFYNYAEKCYPVNSTALNNLTNLHSNLTTISYWYLFVAFLWLLFWDSIELTLIKYKNRWGKNK